MDSFFCEYNLGQAMEISYNNYKKFSDIIRTCLKIAFRQTCFGTSKKLLYHLPDFLYAAWLSIDDAAASPHSSVLHMRKSFWVIKTTNAGVSGKQQEKFHSAYGKYGSEIQAADNRRNTQQRQWKA